jgi:Galactose oxidase-like, Early set domain
MTHGRARSRWRLGMGTAVGTAVILGAALSTGSAPVSAAPDPGSGSPDQVGTWTPPFEEGGMNTPRCAKGSDGRLSCKPVGYAQAITPDGRVFYFNGIESSENVQFGAVPELSPESRDSRARLLDLRSGTPVWSIPGHDTGGAVNPNIKPGENCQNTDLLGVAGVPGRPGDGFVGSLAGGAMTGTATGIQHNPTCSPDTGVQNSGDMFCADFANLADGRFLVVGGTSWYNEPGDGFDRAHGYPYDLGAVELEGLRSARIFNPSTNDFQQVAPMKYGRWYPTAVTLSDGKVFVASGVTKLIKSSQLSQVRRSETFDPATNTWTENYTGPLSENSLPLNARLFLTPNNKIFYIGAGQSWGPAGEAIDEALFALQQFYNPQTKEWEVVGPNPLGTRSSPFSVALPMRPPYDRMTILTYGGVLGPPPGGELAVPLTQLTTVDRHGDVTNTMGPSLHHPRWFVSGVPLPDGKVLALNGADKDEVIDPGSELPVRTPELYDPATNSWTDMAPESRDRTYHNSAILLPDGRVLSGGHSPIPASYGAHHTLMPGVTANNDKDPSFQIWSPPYLFYGPRPRITHAPHGVAWGSTFSISVDDPSSIATVVAMRTPSQQHVNDSDTRTLELSFHQTGPHTLAVEAPPTGVVAPPGTYYLFVNRHNPKGLTPSVARIFFMGAKADPREAVQPVRDDSPVAHGGTATTPQDDSYQATLFGVSGRAANRSVAAVANHPAITGSRTGIVALLGTLTGAIRRNLPGEPLVLAGALAALALAMGVRTRRWIIRRIRG